MGAVLLSGGAKVEGRALKGHREGCIDGHCAGVGYF